MYGVPSMGCPRNKWPKTEVTMLKLPYRHGVRRLRRWRCRRRAGREQVPAIAVPALPQNTRIQNSPKTAARSPGEFHASTKACFGRKSPRLVVSRCPGATLHSHSRQSQHTPTARKSQHPPTARKSQHPPGHRCPGGMSQRRRSSAPLPGPAAPSRPPPSSRVTSRPADVVWSNIGRQARISTQHVYKTWRCVEHDVTL